MDSAVFNAGIQTLEAVYRVSIPEAQRLAYARALDGLSVAEFRKAISLTLENCRFLPPPAEVLEQVYGSLQDRAIREWDAFPNLSAVGRKAAQSVGGSHAIRSAGDAKMRQQFITAYESYGKGASIAEFETIVIPQEDPPALPAKVDFYGGPDANVDASHQVKAYAGSKSVSQELGIQSVQTRWDCLLHRWWAAVQFGTAEQRERCQQQAQQWGRELPMVQKRDFKIGGQRIG